MNCKHAIELLPWYLNRSLEVTERAAVQEHLEACASCRAELKATRDAMVAFDPHLPVRVLLDRAQGRPAEGWPEATIDAQLAECAECVEQLEMAAESRRALERAVRPEPRPAEDNVRPFREPVERRPRGRWMPYLAAAASIAALVSAAGWMWTGRLVSTLDQRLTTLEAERSGGEGAAADRVASDRLGGAEETAAAPRANVPVIDLFPGDLVLRGSAGGAVPIVDPAPAGAVLILNRESMLEGPFRARLVDESDVVLWSLEGLLPGSAGELTVSLPARPLAPGEYRLELFGPDPRDPVGVYPFAVEG